MRGPAQLRALVLIAVVLDVPVLAWIMRRLTPEPVTEALEVAGVPVDVFRSPRAGPRPAWVFITGAHPLRRREPVVARLAEGLARAGYDAFVPDIAGLGTGSITIETMTTTEAVVRTACEDSDRVALIGASMGAGLALLASAEPGIAKNISVVAAVAPFADLRKLVGLATTGVYRDADGFTEHRVTDLHRRVVARSLAASLADGADRDRLLAELDRIDEAGLDPLEELPRRATGLGADAAAVVALLANRDPRSYDELYETLPPGMRRVVDRLSPLGCCQAVEAAVELIVPPNDEYFPLGEAQSLARSFPHARLTVTRVLDHTRPTVSIRRLVDFAAFGGFVVRGLRAAG